MEDEKQRETLAQKEEKILKFWDEHQIFEKSLKQREEAPRFVFYEGPPTANGNPGIHHLEARAFKDLIPRYKTMQGYYVPRKAGWDTHGLPVEIQVEKELGLKTKKEIEEYGIAEFNAKCRESVWRYKDEWEKFTKRIGYWLDLKHPYITYEPNYIETLWWIIKQISKKNLLYQDFKVLPWCSRCQTGLSSHEVGQGYKKVEDRAVYVKFRLAKNQKVVPKQVRDDHVYVIAWTTTPWTLPGNVALAVGKTVKYVLVEYQSERFIVAKDLIQKVFGEPVAVLQEFLGKDLVGLTYEPLFNVPKLKSPKSYKVYPADFVTTTDGTGVVHTAVMYGEDDYRLGNELGLPKFHTVTEQGRFIDSLGEGLGGLKAKNVETEKIILESLKNRNLLFKEEMYEHDYPFCWRCSTPLLYYAREGWWVKMTKVQKQLLENNQKINWVPKHLQQGRFGEFLKDVRDWAFSRERYWGTPLPIWECEKCETQEVLGSIHDMRKRAWARNEFLFMRHGQATHNVEKIAVPYEDSKEYTSVLTELGKEQVLKTAKLLAKKKIDVVVSSPLTRAKETAAIVAKMTKAKVVVEEGLRDLNEGVFQMKPIQEVRDYFKDSLTRFEDGGPEGESLNALKTRMIAAFRRINEKYQGKRILIVSHGHPLWLLNGALQGLSSEDISKLDYPKVGEVYAIDTRTLPLDPNGNLDLHRPFIDEVLLKCLKCKGTMRRVKEVADVWFDSGAMPWAQAHYPFEHKKDLLYPADFISEAIDQTRGWFYTMLAEGTLLGEGSPYSNVISLGHILDKHGQKMSKSKGNIVNPWEMIEKYGADAVRWYFYTANDPSEPKRFDEEDLKVIVRKFFLILQNSLVFWETYANQKAVFQSKSVSHPLDRWILARLQETVETMTTHLEAYTPGVSARSLENFIEELSTWYIRRSRKRFQSEERDMASAVLRQCLVVTAKLLAPFAPFFAEGLYRNLRTERDPISVHLTDWPKRETNFTDPGLITAMKEVREVSSAALALRAEIKIKIRQPLASLTLKNDASLLKINEALLELIKEEVNVKEILFNTQIEKEMELDTEITPELYEEGMLREITRVVQQLRQKANLAMSDRIDLFVKGSPSVIAPLRLRARELQGAVGASKTSFFTPEEQFTQAFDAELDSKIDEEKIWIGIRIIK